MRSFGQPSRLRHRRDVLADGLVREQPDLLDHVADLTAQVAGLTLEHAAAAEQDVARGHRDHAVDQPHRCRLARAGRADEHAHLAGGHRQRQLADRGLALPGIPLADLSQLELGRVRERRRPLVVGGVCNLHGSSRAGAPILAHRRGPSALAGPCSLALESPTGARSSVGQSTSFTPRGSPVRVGPRPSHAAPTTHTPP